MSSVKILHKDCDLSVANNRDLPYDSYVVTYIEDGRTCYDIVQPRKRIDIFDYYWDHYREDFKPPWRQSEGRVNPKLWGCQPKESKKKK
jgi:hypothetical protein